MTRKAKIVATMGPASQDPKACEKVLLAGVDVARLNFSHGTHESHAGMISQLREFGDRARRPLAILQDLQGPKIRVGALKRALTLSADRNALLFPEEGPIPRMENGKDLIPVDFPQLFVSVKPRDRILLDDGRLALSVLTVDDKKISAEVEIGGTLTSHKGINLPGVTLDIPAFTEKDADDLKFGLAHSVDYVAISFVRKAEDILQVRHEITCQNPVLCPQIIAKLERPEALDNLDAIMDAADGVMVARGDLGVEMAPEDVPGAQKHIIRSANRHGKMVITATQMLESMIHNPLPTRAEASDVANAIFDGTDAVMLSGETAMGEYPVEAVKMMDRIVREAENGFDAWGHVQDIESSAHDDAAALTRAARELAHDQDVAAIAVFTRLGRSAFLMAKSRPRVPILAFTPESETYRRLALAWGVQPHTVPFVETVEEMFSCVEKELKDSGLVKTGNQVILVCGFPIGEMRPPNMILLHTIQ